MIGRENRASMKSRLTRKYREPIVALFDSA